MHADERAPRPYVTLPAQLYARFHCNPPCYGRRQHAFLVLIRLHLKQLPRRHAYHACPDAFCVELFKCLDSELDFRACCEQQNLWIRRAYQNIRTTRNVLSRGILRLIQYRQLLTSQRDDCRTRAMFECILPGICRFICVRGTEDDKARHCTQRRKMLHCLVSRAVFPKPDTLVCVDEDCWVFRERRKPYCRAHIVREAEKRGSVWYQHIAHRNAVHDRTHAMLAYAVPNVAATSIGLAEISRSLEPCVI